MFYICGFNLCIGWVVRCINKDQVYVIDGVNIIDVQIKVWFEWYVFDVYVIGFCVDGVYIVGWWVNQNVIFIGCIKCVDQ